MIEIRDVYPSPNEVHPVTRGWGWVHWVVWLPSVVPYLVMSLLAVLVAAWGPEGTAPVLAVALLIGGSLLTMGSGWAVQAIMRRKALSSAAASGGHDWAIDDAGVSLTNAVLQTRYRWEGFHGVLDEKDRFVFLISVAGGLPLPKRYLAAEQIDALRALVADVRASGRMGRGVD